MKILLIGANGQVGWEVARRAVAAGHELLALDRTGLDITDAGAVTRVLSDSRAEIVINAAAYTAVDRAEHEPEMAFAVNRDGPAHLAAACADLGLPLLHLSTDYVFDGWKRPPGGYSEDDTAAPLSVYGQSKWEGEEALRRILPTHLILRVSWVFGVHGHNFVKTMLRLAREREELRVVADQYGCPTYAGDIAATLLTLIERVVNKGLWGTYHYCGNPVTSWHGFAQAIVATARAYGPLKAHTVVPIATADYPTPAARPANSVLDCSRIRERIGIESPAWLSGLQEMLQALPPGE